MKISFKVSLKIPRGATAKDCEHYIRNWVRAGSGLVNPPRDDDPGDPMSNLSPKTVQVKRIA